MEKLRRSATEKGVRMKDRGDTLRKRTMKDQDTQKTPPDRGDVKRIKKLHKADKQPSKNDSIKPEGKVLVSQSTNTVQEQYEPRIKPEPQLLEYRQRIRQRYTLRPKVSPRSQPKKELEKIVESPPNKVGPNELKDQRSKSRDSRRSKSDKASVTEPSGAVKRKPIIKTITSKNDTDRVFKAVTFEDQKRSNPLQIKIPVSNAQNGQNGSRKPRSRIPKLQERKVQVVQSKLSIEKPVKRRKKAVKLKREKKVNFVPSPSEGTSVSAAKILSPPTEVAKWSPSVNKHSMPYYEAWVNTTLAAISKYSKKDKLFLERQNVLDTFKRQLQERDQSPHLVYENFKDERYTGKIKIHQR